MQDNSSSATVNAPARKIAIVLNAEDYGCDDEYITVEAANDIDQDLKLCARQVCMPESGEKIFYYTAREGCWDKSVTCPTQHDCGICNHTMNNIKSIIDKYINFNLISSAHAADQDPGGGGGGGGDGPTCPLANLSRCNIYPGGGYDQGCCSNYGGSHGHCELKYWVDSSFGANNL